MAGGTIHESKLKRAPGDSDNEDVVLHPVADRPPRLVLRFAVYSAVALLLAGLGILWFVRHEEQQRAERLFSEHATLVARGIAGELVPEDFARPVGAARRIELDKAFSSEVRPGVIRVNLWSGDGTLTYSNEHSLIGRRTSEPEELARVLRGQPFQGVSRLPNELRADPDAKVVEAFVPVRLQGAGEPVGALELFQDYSPIANDIESVVRPIAIALGLALLLLYAALFPMLRQVTKAFEQRNRRLTKQSEELKRTLTQREQTQKKLREAQASYRALVEQVPAVIYTDRIDEYSSAVYMSPQIESILGYSQEEWLSDKELFVKILHPDDRDRVMAEITRARASGDSFSSDYRLIARDGRVVWFHDEARHVADESGRPQYAQGYLLDITERKQAAEALQESEERFRTLVSNVPGVIFRCALDSSWTMEYISEEIETISGYPASDFVANARRTFASVIHPDDAERVERIVHEAVAAGSPYEVEYRIVSADGGVRSVLERGQAVFGAEGDLVIDGAIFDVTARKQADAKRLELAAIVESSDDAIVAAGLDGRIVSWNSGAERVFGYSAEEILGRPISVLSPFELREERAELFGRVLSGEGIAHHETVRVRRDGGRIDVSLTVSPIRDSDGKIVGASAIARDVTEGKRAEAERLKLAAIVESSEDAIIGADLDGRITSWNAGAERMYGYSAKEVLGRPLSILAPPELADEPFQFLEEIKQAGGYVRRETTRVRKDGSPVDVSVTMSAIPDTAGKVVGVSIIKRDVTERRQAERQLQRLLTLEREQNERLRELDKLKDEFVALVSHELRTPLTSIRGYLELVLDGEAGELTEEQRQFLGVVERNAHRLLALVGDLLFLAQIEAGRLSLELGAVDLDALASDSVEGARPFAEEKGVTLTLATGPLPLLAGDRARLSQLFDNLVSNGLKFTPEGGRVDVRVRGQRGNAVLEVRDTGIGIPADEQEHLFERFFRGSNAAERQIQGTGLGLAICRAIVEAHGGRINVASEENGGTSVRITLPIRQPQITEPEPAEAVALAPDSAS